jgi:hypothetical protein
MAQLEEEPEIGGRISAKKPSNPRGQFCAKLVNISSTSPD